jgi:glycogen operon protein
MTSADWSDAGALAIGLYLDGSDGPDHAADGTPLLDNDFLVLVNAWWEPLEFVLPVTREDAAWRLEVDTHAPVATAFPRPPRPLASAGPSAPRSVVVLSDPRPD